MSRLVSCSSVTFSDSFHPPFCCYIFFLLESLTVLFLIVQKHACHIQEVSMSANDDKTLSDFTRCSSVRCRGILAKLRLKRPLVASGLVSLRLLLEIDEEVTAGFTERIKAAVDAHAVQFLATSAVELENLEAWCDVPDVCEGDVGELASPLGSDADAAAEGHDHVAEVLIAVEAFVPVM